MISSYGSALPGYLRVNSARGFLEGVWDITVFPLLGTEMEHSSRRSIVVFFFFLWAPPEERAYVWSQGDIWRVARGSWHVFFFFATSPPTTSSCCICNALGRLRRDGVGGILKAWILDLNFIKPSSFPLARVCYCPTTPVFSCWRNKPIPITASVQNPP